MQENCENSLSQKPKEVRMQKDNVINNGNCSSGGKKEEKNC